MQLTNAILALTIVVSVTAHPSFAAHRHHHAKKSSSGFYKAINGNSGGVKAEAVTTSSSSSSSSSPSSTTPASSSQTSASSSPKTWACSASSKRATEAQINYVGNTGSPYGCNWMEIDAGDVPSFDYTITLESPDYDVTCQCWNKIGPKLDGTNGQFNDMLKVSIPKGSSKYLALQANTQGACGCAVGSSVPKGKYGDFLGTWVEVDVGSTVNVLNGVHQSGADVSALAVQDNEANGGGKHDYPGMKISANGNFCSGMTANNGASYHAYVLGTNANLNEDIHDANGVGCKGYGLSNLHVQIGDVTWDNMGHE